MSESEEQVRKWWHVALQERDEARAEITKLRGELEQQSRGDRWTLATIVRMAQQSLGTPPAPAPVTVAGVDRTALLEAVVLAARAAINQDGRVTLARCEAVAAALAAFDASAGGGK